MSGKREAKRADLKARLISAASRRIEESGLANLRARDVTADAGCALGGLYNAFDDLDHLIMVVNLETLSMMETALSEAATANTPREVLKQLAHAYARFAEANRRRWDALFDHHSADGSPAPNWMRAKNADLLTHIAKPLAAINPGASEETLNRRARTYFAAVHGIVSISLQGRFIGLPREALLTELNSVVDALADATGKAT